VGHPAVAAFARVAEGSVNPTRKIAGQNTLFTRTMHDMAYDPVRDEIIVPQFYAFAILTFRGDADGDVAPVRKIFGPRTQLKNSEAVAIDPIHGEIFVPSAPFANSGNTRVLVFPRDADGDVAPIRILEGPDTGLRLGRVTVDPVNNLLITSGGGGLRIFDRTASGNTKPRAVISGDLGGLMTTYPPKGLILTRVGAGDRHDAGDYIGVWSIHDNGNVPARWTIGKGVFYDIRGIAIDPKNKIVIVTDKTLNAIVTFYVPEIF
jgi:hypothetical protein